ncbi:2OG-Fe(II) oxygenase family protein [Sphingomonas sp. AX6]|uniref:2OG-Fe(II) oxygenase family protein n=1 Tax=Sphingomonas sp. AX6 TaxID=2653171 RepID=UPI0012F0C2A3|nr:putative 2OG-Fe(II) oxygenase [Sphingomonas sp. AX6]VXC87145.1 TPR domain protein [Sphingomonas sp. AX6]
MSAATMREAAIAAERASRFDDAAALFRNAVDAHPNDAALSNSAGSFHARRRDHIVALGYFDRAVGQSQAYGEAIVNRAVSLSALGRGSEALKSLQSSETLLSKDARYWSTRAGIERDSGNLAAAAQSYDRCLAIQPQHSRALHGRARMALERGEPGTVARYRHALSVEANNAEIWLGQSQAMEIEGDAAGARSITQSLVDQVPGWVAALELLAQQRWSAGERATFCDHYTESVRRQSGEPEIYRSWCRMLAGVDRFIDAAQIAAAARLRFPENPDFALIEAVHAGEAGDDERADAIFATLSLDTDHRRLQEARHRLRLRQPADADALLDTVLRSQPGNISAWALRDLTWRLLEDPRHTWLHGQQGLIGIQPLSIDAADYNDIVGLLDRLHDHANLPVGQSVRDGTQTWGGLFDRTERQIALLSKSIEAAIARYRTALPPTDIAHPLLRHRDDLWRVVGSWSIRLTGHGRHTEHIHPLGLVSSAAHLIVPRHDASNPSAGVLELGRSPPDLRLDLPPMARIVPTPGHCVFFPSTLYHGTQRFDGGKRLSLAFDVALA